MIDTVALISDVTNIAVRLRITHGTMPEPVGKSHEEFKDADGKYFVQAYLLAARKHGHGWVDFRWLNPKTGAVQQKSGYVERVGNVAISCGIYKQTTRKAVAPSAGNVTSLPQQKKPRVERGSITQGGGRHTPMSATSEEDPKFTLRRRAA